MAITICQSGEAFLDGDGHRTLPLRTIVGGAEGPLILYRISQADKFEERVTEMIEGQFQAPYFDRASHERTLEYVKERGLNLASNVQIPAMLNGGTLFSEETIELVGGSDLFGQAWEAIYLTSTSEPWAVRAPIVRIIRGTSAYECIGGLQGEIRVIAVAARMRPFVDLPPRQVTKPLEELTKGNQRFQVGVVTPAMPNLVESALTPDEGAGGVDVVHIDCHGLLLTYEQLMRTYDQQRKQFEELSWGQRIEPYTGKKGFILIDFAEAEVRLSSPSSGSLPVAGEEFAELCRRSRVRAVVLNACESASFNASGSFAADIVTCGVPQAVAVRHKFTAVAARIFAAAFYGALSQGRTIAESACSARKALHEQRNRKFGYETVDLGDWLSIVHYSVEHGRQSLTTTVPMSDHPYPDPQTLPIPLEWKIYQIQELAFRQRVEEQEEQAHRALVLAGPIGLGAEITVQETARWMAKTDLSSSGAFVLNLSNGLSVALHEAFGIETVFFDFEEVIDILIDISGPAFVLVVMELDIARDKGTISSDEFGYLGEFVDFVIGRGHLCLVPMSQNSAFEMPILTRDAYLVSIHPMTFSACEEFIFHQAYSNIDPEFQLLLQLGTWLSAGFGEIIIALKSISDVESLRTFLDFLVFGGKLLPPVVEESLGMLIVRTAARYQRAAEEGVSDAASPAFAALGAGFLLTEINMVGQGIGKTTFPGAPQMHEGNAVSVILEYHRRGLITTPAPNTVPREWEQKKLSAYLCNPLLRPIARAKFSEAELEVLDAWTVAWAIDKLNTFSSRFADAQGESVLRPYLEHGRPLFASAIWIALRGRASSAPLQAAINTARMSGWWPAHVNPTPYFADHRPPNDIAYQTELDDIDALSQRGAEYQRNGYFADARVAIEHALALLTIGQDHIRRTDLLLQLATITADEGDTSRTAELLNEAQISITKYGPKSLLPDISFERGCLLKALNRKKDAKSEFNSAIELARKYHRPHIECLSFQELADLELATYFVGGGADNLDRDTVDLIRLSITQAEDYTKRAETAANNANQTEWELPVHILLRARMALLEGFKIRAKEMAIAARDSFRLHNDRRVVAAENFLAMIAILCAE